LDFHSENREIVENLFCPQKIYFFFKLNHLCMILWKLGFASAKPPLPEKTCREVKVNGDFMEDISAQKYPEFQVEIVQKEHDTANHLENMNGKFEEEDEMSEGGNFPENYSDNLKVVNLSWFSY
jgi:hypothetical protein